MVEISTDNRPSGHTDRLDEYLNE